MSIINDALKKAEKESRIGEIKTPTKRWFVWAGTGVLCFLGIILATHFFKQPLEPIFVQNIGPSSESTPSSFQLRKTDVEAPLDYSAFKLSGVLYDQQRPLAIINDRVVEEGTFINGAKLLEIQTNFVKLSLDGEEFTLKIE